jgi:signal transduction histidine kinase
MWLLSGPVFAMQSAGGMTASYAVGLRGNPLGNPLLLSQFIDMPDQQLALGFQEHPVWVKIKLQQAQTGDDMAFLVITPPRHEQVTLYQENPDTRAITVIESLPSLEKVLFFTESQKNIFMLGRQRNAVEYFLKIEPFGPMNIQLHLKSSDQLESDFHNKVFSLGGAVFSTVIFFLLTGFLYKINREIIYVYFLGHVLASVLVFIATLGFGLTVLKNTFDWDLNLQLGIFMIANITTGFLLFSHILQLMALPDWIAKYINTIPIINLLFLVWFMAGHSQSAWLYSTVFGMAACLLYGAAFLRFFDKKLPSQWVLAVFSSVIVLLLLLLMSALLGLLSFSSQVLQPNILRIGLLPVIFGLIFWFYEVIKRERLSAIEIEKSTEARSFEQELKRRKTYEGFMGMLVHEIKTPLSIIQIASISLGRRFTSTSNEFLRVTHIDKAVNDINDILNKCVQVSDIENNTVFVDKSQVNVDELVTELQGLFKSSQIEWKHCPGLQVFTDYILLRTILSNLLSNALKYADSQQAIVFRCDASTDADLNRIKFAVSNALGAAGSPDPEQVFQRYYRGSRTSGQPGTGLGLWLSQQIAKVIGTDIHMELQKNLIHFHLSFSEHT